MTQAKSKSCDKFNLFRIMAVLTLWDYKQFETGLMNWRIFFVNICDVSELWRPGPSLFHSEIEGKKEFLKKLCFTLKMEMLCTFLKVSDERLTGIKWKTFWKCSFLKTFLKKREFSVPTSESKGGSKPNLAR